MAPVAEWIAVDWGTSKLRAWVIGADGAVLARAQSDKGMNRLGPKEFEPALLDLIGPYLRAGQTTEVIACGMVGARQGWAEAEYVAVPCAVPGLRRATLAPANDPRLAVHILPGVCQARPADVMRGEETQIGGFLAGRPDFDGVICLPGTHTKWVHVSAGEIVSFRTFLTGELFALLSEQSVLRHALAGGEGWDSAAFAEAVADAMSAPQDLTARLFALRAASLLEAAAPETGRARLSGLLIGQELAGARPYWLGREIALVGAPHLCDLYQAALAAQGAPASRTEAQTLTLAGLTAARAAKEGT